MRPLRRRDVLDLTTPRPIAAADKVWIEELTWMEIRDAMKAGKTTALIVTGSTQQNGPYIPPASMFCAARDSRSHCPQARRHSDRTGDSVRAWEFLDDAWHDPGFAIPTTRWSRIKPSLEGQRLRPIVLIGDSGSNQRGLERGVTGENGRAAARRFTTSKMHGGRSRRRVGLAWYSKDDG